MLVLQSIKIKFEKSVIPVKIKTITIGYNKSYCSNKKKYHQISTHLFQWNQSMTLPLYYNVPLQCNCRTDDTFDNPEDPNSTLNASIKIIDYKQTVLQASLLNKLKVKVAEIVINFRVLNEKLIVPEDKGRLIISSILAHFQNHYGASGFMQLTVGYKSLFTPTANVVAGQLLWSEQLTIPLEQTSNFKGTKEQLIMKIIVDEKPVGFVKFKIDSIRNLNIKYKKFKIIDSNDQTTKIGTLFLDITYKDGTQVQKPLQNQYSLSVKKHQESLRKKQSSQKIFNHPSLLRQEQKQSSRSERMLPDLNIGRQQSQPLLAQPSTDNPKKPKRRQADLFQGVFDLGSLVKQQNIRQIFRERRNKVSKNSSLPKIK